jgi:integrase
MGRCRPLSTDEIESMKAHCQGPQERALISFFERTGYRAAETASLKVKDVWDGHQLRDRVQVERRHMKKSVGRRPIPLHSELRKTLVCWLMQLQQSHLLCQYPIHLSGIEETQNRHARLDEGKPLACDQTHFHPGGH